MRPSTRRQLPQRSSFVCQALVWACVLVGGLSARPARAQNDAACLSATERAAPAAGTTVRIAAGTTYSGTLVISNDNVTICNSGTLAGTILVSSGVKGTVINNLGTVTSQTIYLNAATTINNGSAGGPAVVKEANWAGYIGDTFNVAPTINNYATFTGEINTLPGGTINNKSGAVWNGAISNSSAALTITNDGTWQSPLMATGSLRITNTGTWANCLTANEAATITNLGYWPTQTIKSPLAFAIQPGGIVSLTSKGQ